MRQREINKIVDSNVDLTKATNSRINVTMLSPGVFLFTSRLKVYSCERSSFIERQIERVFGKPRFITGNCSSPTGYIF